MKMHSFGQWLRWQRARRRWTQRQVEEALNLDHSQYSKWENDRNRPEPGTRKRFHDLYETTEDDLVELGILRSYSAIDGAIAYEWADSEPSPSPITPPPPEPGTPYVIGPDDSRYPIVALLDNASPAKLERVRQLVELLSDLLP